MERGCLDSGQTLIVDLDGVVWLGRKPIEENVTALKSLISRGYRVLFLTNNSTRSRAQYVRMLRDLGISVGIDSVITSGYLAASWLYEQKGASEVYIIGEEGLIEEAVLAHHKVLTGEEAVRSTAVIVGLDRNLTYQKLRAATRALLNGSLFIATNTDHVIPVEDGLDPGAGAIVAALESATGRKPDFIAGKPNPWIIDLVEKRLGISRQNLVIVGDRMDTDMRLAMAAEVRGILVLTGLTGEDIISKTAEPARLSMAGITIARTLKDLVDRC